MNLCELDYLEKHGLNLKIFQLPEMAAIDEFTWKRTFKKPKQCAFIAKFAKKMWTVAAMNKKFNDVLGNYNSLKDPHLTQFFKKPDKRKHLVKSGLMTVDGKIVSERGLRLNDIGFERRKHLQTVVDDFLRNGFKNCEEMRKVHENNLIEEKIKADLIKRAKLLYLNRKNGKIFPRKTDKAFEIRRKPRWKFPVSESVRFHAENIVHNSSVRLNRPMSSYGRRISNIEEVDEANNDETNDVLSEIQSLDGESFHEESEEITRSRSVIAYNKYRRSLSANEAKYVKITFVFNGITQNNPNPRFIRVTQQRFKGCHCIDIYSNFVRRHESFVVPIKPHESHPFCITMFVDNLRDFRINTCCELKHRKGSQIGHFTITNIENAVACESCRNQDNNLHSYASKWRGRNLTFKSKSAVSVSNATNKTHRKGNGNRNQLNSVKQISKETNEMKINEKSDENESVANNDYEDDEFEKESTDESNKNELKHDVADSDNSDTQSVISVELM